MTNQLEMFDDVQVRGAIAAFPMERNRLLIRQFAERLAKVADKRLTAAVTDALMPMYEARLDAGFSAPDAKAEMGRIGTAILAERANILNAEAERAARSATIIKFADARFQRGGIPPATPAPTARSGGTADAPLRRRPGTQTGGHGHA